MPTILGSKFDCALLQDAPEESTEYELILGPLKDPVRVHEKAASVPNGPK